MQAISTRSPNFSLHSSASSSTIELLIRQRRQKVALLQ
jgi:hypothetical protein